MRAVRIFLLLGLTVISLKVFAGSASVTAFVEGMTCASCAGAIEKQVKNIPNVESVNISIQTGKVVVLSKEGKSVSTSQIQTAIEAAGYKVKTIE